MLTHSIRRLVLGAILAALLCGPQQAAAQAIAAPARAVAPPRGASCHGGLTFDRFLAGAESAGRGRGGFAARARRSLALSRLRPGHRQSRSRPARVRAGIHRVRRPNGGELPDAARSGTHRHLCRGVRTRRKGIWRTAGGDRRVLGTGKRFRRQHGQSADAALAGFAGLRLPPLADVCRTKLSPR